MLLDASAQVQSPVEAARSEVLEVAEAQRVIRRETGAFFTMGWLALHDLSINVKAPAEERQMAAELLRRYGEGCRALIELLPGLENKRGEPTGAFAVERFNIFAEFPMLKNLDLSRREHLSCTWGSADAVEDELESLGKYLAAKTWLNPITGLEEHQYEIEELPRTEASCGMHFQVISEEALDAGVVYLGRNSSKLRITNRITGEVYCVNKRTEFIIDANDFTPDFGPRFLDMLAQTRLNPDDNLRLKRARFEWMDGLIADRHPAIKPVYTRLFVFRDACILPTPLVESDELRGYPQATKAATAFRED